MFSASTQVAEDVDEFDDMEPLHDGDDHAAASQSRQGKQAEAHNMRGDGDKSAETVLPAERTVRAGGNTAGHASSRGKGGVRGMFAFSLPPQPQAKARGVKGSKPAKGASRKGGNAGVAGAGSQHARGKVKNRHGTVSSCLLVPVCSCLT